jgi:hypothetical protein
MSVSAKFKRDAHIAARREMEFKETNLINAIKGNNNLNLMAKWEHKSEGVVNRNIVRNRIADVKKRAAADLKLRKARLAELLAAEDKQYEKEFMDNLETL